jgi:hypothetical protein
MAPSAHQAAVLIDMSGLAPSISRAAGTLPFNLHSSARSYNSLKDKVNECCLIKAGKRSSYV